MITQIEIILPPYKRGFHLITHLIEQQMGTLPKVGLVNILIQHTSAGITLNENADPTVRQDLKNYIDKIAPENAPYFEHTLEGADDMPAHIKSSLIGAEITLPVSNHRLNLGTWQGIYLGEFRNHGGCRRLIVTIMS